jgi:hypothetical protein
LRRLLIQCDLEAAPQQCQGSDDAADAGAGDQDAWLGQVLVPFTIARSEPG